jgi:hypothetical protein
MRITKNLIYATIAVLGLISCKDDDEITLLAVESNQEINLHAPQTSDYTTNPPSISGDFVKFDFSTGAITTSDTDWDIAFRGTTIAVNGGTETGSLNEPERNGNSGAYIVSDVFANVTSVTESLFTKDSSSGFAIPTGSGNGWYDYNYMNNQITPIAGKVLVIRTADDFYAKVEILSYYKDLDPSNPANARYYTFNYIYQPNQGVTTFED